MNSLWDKIVDDILPGALGILLTVTITMFLLGACIWSIKWVFTLMGVL